MTITLTPAKQRRPGPRAAADDSPLDLSMLPSARDWRRFAAFCEHFLTHPNGEPIKLKPYQQEIAKGILPVRGGRPAMGLLSIARGQAKTEIASWLACYCLFADEVQGPEVLVIASSLEQAQRQIFRRVVGHIERNPELLKRSRISRDAISTPWNSGTLTALASTEASLQGWNHSAGFLDELHVVDSVVWESVVTASLKRTDSLTLAISTPPSNPQSIMKELADKAKSEPDKNFFYREWTSDLDHDPLCAHCVRQSRPLTGGAKGELSGLASLLRKVPEGTYRRLMLGQWDTPTDEQWLSLAQLDPLRVDRVLEPGERCVLAFDGSWSGDCTGLVAVTLEEVPFITPIRWWKPGDGEHVPVGEVEDAIRAACELYDVLEVTCDSYRWQKSLDQLSNSGLPMLDFPQTPARMSPATVGLHSAVADQRVRLSKDPTLLEHFLNARVKNDERGVRIAKINKDSENKIDLAVCAVMGHSRALHHLSKIEKTKKFYSW